MEQCHLTISVDLGVETVHLVIENSCRKGELYFEELVCACIPKSALHKAGRQEKHNPITCNWIWKGFVGPA